MRFIPKTFHETVVRLLQESDRSLETLVDAYLWAQTHLKEIHAVTPTYEQQWLAGEIRRIFNVDVTTYVRTAKRLGGGASEECFEKGKAAVKKFGVFETFRATSLLPEESMPKILESIPENATVDDFRKTVDHHARKLQRLAEENRERQPKDLKLECIRLESQLKKAKAENEQLKKENARLKAALNEIRNVQQKILA